MKVGAKLAKQIAEIPEIHKQAIEELLALLEKEKVTTLRSCTSAELPEKRAELVAYSYVAKRMRQAEDEIKQRNTP